MKSVNKLLIAAVLIAAIASCKKKDQTTSVPVDWAFSTLADSSVLGFGESILFKSNYDKANYTVTRGTINDSGRYIVPATQGKIVVTVKNPNNANDSLRRTYFISQYKSIFDQMRSGGYVLSFRHGDASDGSDQFNSATTQWWKSCSNTLARQLTPTTGPLQCTELGLAMRIQKLPIKRAFSSEYCRCESTARLFNLPVPTVLNTNITYYVYDEANRYQLQMDLIGNQPIDNSNTVVVGHAGFGAIPPTYNGVLNQLAWGDAAVFRLNGSNNPTYITTLAQGTLRGMLY